MTQTMVGLTEEISKRLSVPVPGSEIQTKRQGGADIRFTSEGFVRHRLDEVVGAGGWSDDYEVVAYAKPPIKVVGSGDKKRDVHFLGVVTCRLTVLGTTKSGEADLEFDPTMYGTPATNAQARAFKRAAMKFGIAAELWDKEHVGSGDDDETPRNKSSYAGSSNRSSASSSSNGRKGLSEKQVAYLTGKAFQVPLAVVEKLTPGTEGTGSALITGLKDIQSSLDEDEYDESPRKYIAQVLKKIGQSGLIPLLSKVSELEGADNDEDLD